MARCPRCLAKARKKKEDDSSWFYSCRRHGFVREVLSPPAPYLPREVIGRKTARASAAK